MPEESIIERNREALEGAYYTMYDGCLYNNGMWDAWRKFESALVDMGILEPDEEEEEE